MWSLVSISPLRLLSWILVKMLMFGWDFEVDAWSRFWRWKLVKIFVWTFLNFGKLNSTLGSVVPLAMFLICFELRTTPAHVPCYKLANGVLFIYFQEILYHGMTLWGWALDLVTLVDESGDKIECTLNQLEFAFSAHVATSNPPPPSSSPPS